jgi:hypothetical protein
MHVAPTLHYLNRLCERSVAVAIQVLMKKISLPSHSAVRDTRL